ncbi:hypothetical protein [Paenimyroides baculatum]|uniref:Uncharacterized protein n=1 Tax=Paenimyroides baculatum TaxID=2608000 RepID=A0A5M6CA91_9FLAO|nr:hypothetical protein [Paenimyroides baculatum]KAA5532068.1 hypothetical protein F0460_13740 [Paenimyroides baculatum]
MMRLFLCLIASIYTATSFAAGGSVLVERSVKFKKEGATPSYKQSVRVYYKTTQTTVPLNIPSYFFKKALKNPQFNLGSTYMWKSAFESTVNDTLLSQLNKYGIDTLLLSPGTNGIKITDFLTKAQNQSIHVSRLLSENSYAKDANGVQKLIAKMQTLQYDFPGLHLNIEPHTFADYKANIPFYTARMDSIYDVAKQWCDPRNMKLSVSIPMHLPIQNATFLATNNITAYIMAYENTDQQKLLTRTQLLRTTLGNNYVWVIRVSDFATQQDLLDAVAYLNANGVSRVALYDFSTVSTMF